MPCYSSDEVVPFLLDEGHIDSDVAARNMSAPVAFRRECDTVEEAVTGLVEDGEIPLAA